MYVVETLDIDYCGGNKTRGRGTQVRRGREMALRRRTKRATRIKGSNEKNFVLIPLVRCPHSPMVTKWWGGRQPSCSAAVFGQPRTRACGFAVGLRC